MSITMLFLLMWSIVGIILFLKKYWNYEESPDGELSFRIWLDVLLAGPLTWIVVGIYEHARNKKKE